MSEEKKTTMSTRSFRISAESEEKIKALAKELETSQEGAFQALIAAYEINQATITIPERKTEIENFRLKVNEIVDAYLHSIQLNLDAEARIRADYQAALTRNAETIDMYQGEVSGLKAQLKEANELAAQATALKAELDEVKSQAREDREDAAERLAEKERLIRNLDGQIVDLTAKAAGYPELKVERDELIEKLRDAQQTVKDEKKDHELELARAAAAAERDKATALAEAKDAATKMEHELRDQMLAATAAESATLATVKAEAERVEHDLRDQLLTATREMGDLREQLATAKGELARLRDMMAQHQEKA